MIQTAGKSYVLHWETIDRFSQFGLVNLVGGPGYPFASDSHKIEAYSGPPDVITRRMGLVPEWALLIMCVNCRSDKNV